MRLKKKYGSKSRPQLIIEQVDFFDKVNIGEAGILKLTRVELIELILLLNKQMVDSTDNWDGG